MRYVPAVPKMADEPNYITPAGHEKLMREYEHLQKLERPKVVQEVQDAAAQGDRSENAEYIYGKRRLREIDSRLRFLSSRLKNAQLIDPSAQSGDRVFFGATVDVETEEAETVTYRIVGVDETDLARGMISWRSPLGRALLKKKKGDTVLVKKPGGDDAEFTILAVRYVPMPKVTG